MDTKNKLGKLKKVELREGRKHEANDFTKWLSQEENLRLLGDEIGFDLKLVQTEANVGSFNVDILAEEENTGHKIIIENQLEVTNHDHLGKLITYASGYDAKVIIWVVKDVREEHRQAIDWLNEHTDEDIEFYLLQIELWQIGESPFAPKFEIISKPNDWAKTVRSSVESKDLTETKIKQMEFWDGLKAYAKINYPKIRPQKSHPQHWLNISIGSSQAHVCLSINSREHLFTTEIWIGDNKDFYHNLEGHKDEIESELKEKLEWLELPEKKASRIKISTSGDFNNQGKWEEYFEWLLQMTEKFQKVFPKFF
jgi:hypothetical protein